ncbi:MAG: haloacid dehalogenase-like hydrolase [Solirubrobacteraceae bacterium]
MLLLFDIDGTLLRDAAEAHAHALLAALHEIHGIGGGGRWPRVAAAGRTDMEIAREIASVCGVPAERFEERRAELVDASVREYVQLAPDDLRERVIEGIAPLLSELAVRDDVLLSLLTGNLEPIARLKLERAGLGGFFIAGQGAFGSDSDDRTDLPAIARGRAGMLLTGAARASGDPHPRERTIVIGDTERDVICAHADGVRCFAVATGPLRRDGLIRADAVAEDTDQLRELLLSVMPAGGV